MQPPFFSIGFEHFGHAFVLARIQAASLPSDTVFSFHLFTTPQPTGWCWSLEPCWAARAPGRRRTPPPSARRLVRVASGLEPM